MGSLQILLCWEKAFSLSITPHLSIYPPAFTVTYWNWSDIFLSHFIVLFLACLLILLSSCDIKTSFSTSLSCFLNLYSTELMNAHGCHCGMEHRCSITGYIYQLGFRTENINIAQTWLIICFQYLQFWSICSSFFLQVFI